MENSKRMNKVLAGFFSEGGYVTSEISDGDTFFVSHGGESYFLKFCKENEGSDYLPGECLFHTEKQLELEGDLLIITAQNVYLRDDPWFQETIRKKLVQRMIPDMKRRKPSRINV